MVTFRLVGEDGAAVGVFRTPASNWRVGDQFYVGDDRFRVVGLGEAAGRGADGFAGVLVVRPVMRPQST